MNMIEPCIGLKNQKVIEIEIKLVHGSELFLMTALLNSNHIDKKRICI